jgi:hypothetical protein
MMRRTVLLLTCVLLAVPAWAGEGESFDPDQPFRQTLNHRLLESLLIQAMEAIEEHIEISGNIDSEKGQPERMQSLRFKFYPEGKSKSERHFSAEGWFGPSTDSDHQELHFRFSLPKSSELSTESLDNVL